MEPPQITPVSVGRLPTMMPAVETNAPHDTAFVGAVIASMPLVWFLAIEPSGSSEAPYKLPKYTQASTSLSEEVEGQLGEFMHSSNPAPDGGGVAQGAQISRSAVGAASYTALEPPLPFAPPDFEDRVQQAIQKSRAGWQKVVSTKQNRP
jgi:hypothetical protein